MKELSFNSSMRVVSDGSETLTALFVNGEIRTVKAWIEQLDQWMDINIDDMRPEIVGKMYTALWFYLRT